MTYAYGVTLQGTYHVKNDIVCQDAHRYIKCSDDITIAAVADGLGSESHSDIASKTAVEVSTNHCADNITKDSSDEDILKIISKSFELSQKQIEQIAKDNGHEIDQYDTTLSLAVFISGNLFYGHSGDSGIIVYTTEGLYEKVTTQQRDDDGRVFPLYFGEEKWVFGKFPTKVASVLLATDGIYETFFPVYIKNEAVSIYVALAKYFMDNESLHIDEIGEETVQQRIESFIENIPDAQVNDDKTILVVLNTDIKVHKQPDEYYVEPDWKALKSKFDEEWKRQAYPHLYKQKEISELESSIDTINNEDTEKNEEFKENNE